MPVWWLWAVSMVQLRRTHPIQHRTVWCTLIGRVADTHAPEWINCQLQSRAPKMESLQWLTWSWLIVRSPMYPNYTRPIQWQLQYHQTQAWTLNVPAWEDSEELIQLNHQHNDRAYTYEKCVEASKTAQCNGNINEHHRIANDHCCAFTFWQFGDCILNTTLRIESNLHFVRFECFQELNKSKFKRHGKWSSISVLADESFI